jgi:hypothetical protein
MGIGTGEEKSFILQMGREEIRERIYYLEMVEGGKRGKGKRGQVRFCGGIGKKSVGKERDGFIFGIWCWVKKRGRAIWLWR